MIQVTHIDKGSSINIDPFFYFKIKKLYLCMCKTEGCNRERYGMSAYCTPCRHKRYKEADPERYVYQTLVRNARRRNKFLDLTLEEFREFCVATNYMIGKGIYADSLHIDRDKEWLGYTKDNIRVEVNSENVKKYIRWRGRNEEGINEFEVVTITHLPDQSNCPF